MSMKMDKPAVYWHKNQVTLFFPLEVSSKEQTDVIRSSVQTHLDDLNEQVLKDVNATLSFIQKSAVPRARIQNIAGVEQGMNDPGGLDGVYLFPLPPGETIGDGPPSYRSDVVGFFQINPAPGNRTSAMRDKETMQGDSGSMGMGSEDIPDQTLPIVSHLLKNSQPAMPHLLWSGTQDIPTHGCPISPPIPVPDSGDFGQWKIMILDLADSSLQDKTGEGVTVFILDTLPQTDQILEAARGAGDSNTLLQDMVKNSEQVKFTYQPLPDILDVPNPEQPVTGKDIFGNLVGFPMVDHGLFIAGIVHDLAPRAKIECIRILNDFGVGDTDTLTGALQYILTRISEAGDLYQQPVVINLSLVVMPPKNDKSIVVPADIEKSVQIHLFELMQKLADNGAVFVAAAGNDSDIRDTEMNPLKLRWETRYPAHFAYTTPALAAMIPVSAVNEAGEPASYSNQPGPYGITTYGGETPPMPASQSSSPITQLDSTKPLDALCGVYSASTYPALSKGTQNPSHAAHEYPEYQSPNTSAWAYWSGTSFATPIISALAALALQGQASKGDSVRQALTKFATDKITWTGLESGEDFSGPVIMAVQKWQPQDTSLS